MTEHDENDERVEFSDDEPFGIQLERLKARVASLKERVDALERKQDAPGESTPGRD